MSHHANLHALCRSYCETFGVEAAWLDQGDGATAVRIELGGVRVTLTQDERAQPDVAYAFIEYGPCDSKGEAAEAELLATAMYFNLLVPAGSRMRYSRHPSNHSTVMQLVLDTNRFDAFALQTMLQGQVRAAHEWREASA
jgi:hypothetical protein